MSEDKAVWQDLRDILDALKPLGFEYEDAKEAQPRPISEKVRELILRNDVYIGLLTRRAPICEHPSTFRGRVEFAFGRHAATKWCASEWVVEEIGYALGKDRPVILLIEAGVVFPTADLDADTEWIPFQRKNIFASQTGVTQIITNLIAKRVQALPEAAPVATAAPKEHEKAEEPSKPKFGEQLRTLKAHIRANEIGKAEELQSSIVAEMPGAEDKVIIESFLLEFRAQNGDASALVRLNEKVAGDPTDFHSVVSLGGVLSSFKQYDKAAELYVSHLTTADEGDRTAMAIRAAEALRKDGRQQQALQLLRDRFSQEQEERAPLFRAIASTAEDLKNFDLEAAMLEKVIEIHPTDNDARFRLAYIYSENDREKLAAHHYAILESRVDWPVVTNNLGVTYGSLGHSATQIAQYERVRDKFALAKANLANRYAEGGLLEQAETLARSVLSKAEDETADNRARYALEQIAKTRQKESESIGKLAEETRDERKFMLDYASAFSSPAVSDFTGTYTTAHGELKLTFKGEHVTGEGVVVTLPSRGLIALAMATQLGVPKAEPQPETTYLSFDGMLQGRSGTFELTTGSDRKKRAATTLLGGAGKTISGLFVLGSDLREIRFLERHDKERTVTTATRIGS